MSATPVVFGSVTERAPRKRGRGSDPEVTRQELRDAAFTTVRSEGFRGATARAIAGVAGQNQAAIYYHFGGIEELLVAALEESSDRRLARYRIALADSAEIADLRQLVELLAHLHEEDERSGHLQVLSELIGGVTASPALRDGLNRAVQPWLAFVEERIAEIARRHPLGAMVPAADLADLIFSLAVGVQLRNRLDGSTDRIDRLFRLAQVGVSVIGDSTIATDS